MSKLEDRVSTEEEDLPRYVHRPFLELSRQLEFSVLGSPTDFSFVSIFLPDDRLQTILDLFDFTL